ncbi:hypothetical protein M8C21_023247, partial [Ambrosia artemisiifolia]
ARASDKNESSLFLSSIASLIVMLLSGGDGNSSLHVSSPHPPHPDGDEDGKGEFALSKKKTKNTIYAEYFKWISSMTMPLWYDFKHPGDADDARYSLNGLDVDGRRIVVEFSKGFVTLCHLISFCS